MTSTFDLRELMKSGALYVDVRSSEEYAAGHIPGAVNVPWMHGTLAGLVPNPDFEQQLRQVLDARQAVIVGCRSGGRARAVGDVLERLGCEHWIDALGFDGSRDAFGRLTPGWSRQGLPVEVGDVIVRSRS